MVLVVIARTSQLGSYALNQVACKEYKQFDHEINEPLDDDVNDEATEDEEEEEEEEEDDETAAAEADAATGDAAAGTWAVASALALSVHFCTVLASQRSLLSFKTIIIFNDEGSICLRQSVIICFA